MTPRPSKVPASCLSFTRLLSTQPHLNSHNRLWLRCFFWRIGGSSISTTRLLIEPTATSSHLSVNFTGPSLVAWFLLPSQQPAMFPVLSGMAALSLDWQAVGVSENNCPHWIRAVASLYRRASCTAKQQEKNTQANAHGQDWRDARMDHHREA